MRSLYFNYLLISVILILIIALPTLAEPKSELAVDHSQSQAKYDICAALYRDKKYRGAISACTDAIKFSHKLNLSFLYGYRASSYFRLGDKKNAKKDLETGDKTGGNTSKFIYMVLGEDI